MIIHQTLTVVACLAGLVLLYLAAFTYESERQEIQNRLEALWIRIDDLRHKGMGIQLAFFRTTAERIDAFLERLMGSELVSVPAVAFTGGLIFASMNFVLAIRLYIEGNYKEMGFVLLWMQAFIFVAVNAGHKQTSEDGYPLLLFVILGYSWLDMNHYIALGIQPEKATPMDTMPFAVAGLASTGIAFAFLVVTRKVLRWCSISNSFSRILALQLINILLALAIVVAPLILTRPLNDKARLVWLMAITFASGNLIPAFSCILLALMGVMMLLHKLLWPIILRPLHIIANDRVAKNRKLLAVIGVALLTPAFPALAKLVSVFIK